MAVGTQVVSTQALKLLICHELTMGDGGTNAGAVRYQLPILSPPSIVDLTAPIESSPQIVGKYNLDSDQSAHNRAGQMFEISFSVLCSPTVLDLMCLYLMEDGASPCRLLGNYSPPDWFNGADTDYSTEIIVVGGGYGANAVDQDDVWYKGCVMKSLEITHAIDSEGGKPVANCTFVTGYAPTYTDEFTDGVIGYTSITGDSASNFVEWDDDNTWIGSNTAGYELHPYSYSVSMARDIQRVGCADYTNFEPDGYVMVGGWDTSMNIIYKRDENFGTFKHLLYNGSEVILKYGHSADHIIYIRGLVSEHSVDTGSPELRNSITVKGIGGIASTEILLNLEM